VYNRLSRYIELLFVKKRIVCAFSFNPPKGFVTLSNIRCKDNSPRFYRKRPFTLALLPAALLLVALSAIGCAAPSPNPAALESTPAPTSEVIQVALVEPKPSQTPELTPEPTPTHALPLAGFIIGVDPGHQAVADNSLESVSPKYTSMKEKVSPGTKGFWSDVHEYEITLSVGLLLRDILEENGATVIMTRTSNDVNVSNSMRAILFNEAKTDYAVRIHCNGSHDQSKKGASILIPKENPFLDDCKAAAELLLAEYSKATGIEARGLSARGDQTGFNWCERMVINIEMGYMSNPDDDAYLSNTENHKIMAQGMANGILKYFAAKSAAPSPEPTAN
jgi:N-acetylmuramoyl-L-alanine amidase